MGNYCLNAKPEAFITKNKLRVKQHNRTIYLNDGDNFEIELFNPKSTKVLAKISLDGKLISSAGIIIRPGERIFLERYIDSNHKFLFSTYEVNDNNKQVENAIRSNGDLKVEFYDEFVPTNFGSVNYGYNTTFYNNSGTNTFTITPNDGIYYTNGNCGCTTSFDLTGCSTTTSNYSYTTNTSSSNYTSFKCDQSKKIETGNVEKGDKSKQELECSWDNFNSYISSTVDWKILPTSRKPITSSEIKVFCTECGARKRKQSHKFCPNCGNKFE